MHHDHIVRQTRFPKSIGLSDHYYYILVKTALSFGSFRQHYHWILSKFEVLPVLESFTEYSGLFVVLYFIAMHYYYEKYLVKQKDATIKELKSHINKLSQ